MFSVERQRERYEKARADYVQFVDDKNRQQLTYNNEQIHKYRRYDSLLSSTGVVVIQSPVVSVPQVGHSVP